MRDQAESETIGVILLIALAVAIAGGILVWVNGFGSDHAAPQVPFFASEDEESSACTAGAADPLFEIRYRSGVAFRWDGLDLAVLEGSTDHSSVIDWGSGAGVLPATMRVGDTLTATETTNICTAGALESWTVRVIQPSFENTIVYEQVIQVR